VLTAAPHPQADKLQVLTVDQGDGMPLQVVCGAPNARAGLVGVFGVEGAVVPANGMVLKKAAIRGVESNGMMCSTRELELGDDHDGIIELPAEAPVGSDFADYASLNDPVIDVHHPQPAGLHGGARHRARSRGKGGGDTEAFALSVPDARRSAADRWPRSRCRYARPGGLPGLLRPGSAWR
jgi:phenylalanyl-tRNA synthetase beta chain